MGGSFDHFVQVYLTYILFRVYNSCTFYIITYSIDMSEYLSGYPTFIGRIPWLPTFFPTMMKR